MKVLIAEDEQTIANGIAAILKTRGEFHCQIRFAENGQDALEERSVRIWFLLISGCLK